MCDVICLVLVGFCFEIKKIAFVLSCLKWIYNLLPINQLQSEKNSLFNTFSIFSASVLIKDTGIVRKDQVLFNACGKLFIYITKILVEHHNLLVQHLRRHLLVSQKIFCMRDMIETNEWIRKTNTFHFW